jgi:hypothetical protein
MKWPLCKTTKANFGSVLAHIIVQNILEKKKCKQGKAKWIV